MLRVDWNINEQHDASVIYNYYDGIQLRSSDGDDNEFEFANHFYNKWCCLKRLPFACVRSGQMRSLAKCSTAKTPWMTLVGYRGPRGFC